MLAILLQIVLFAGYLFAADTELVSCQGQSYVPEHSLKFTIGMDDLKSNNIPLYLETESVFQGGGGGIKWRSRVACAGDIAHEILCGDTYPRFRLKYNNNYWQAEQSFITFRRSSGKDSYQVEWETIGRRLKCVQNFQVDLNGQVKSSGPLRR